MESSNITLTGHLFVQMTLLLLQTFFEDLLLIHSTIIYEAPIVFQAEHKGLNRTNTAPALMLAA